MMLELTFSNAGEKDMEKEIMTFLSFQPGDKTRKIKTDLSCPSIPPGKVIGRYNFN